MKALVISVLFSSLLIGSASAIQTHSYDLTFTEGALTGIGGSMLTVNLTDGDATGAVANWKSLENGGIVSYQAMIVDTGGGIVDFDSTATGNTWGNNAIRVTGGVVDAGYLVMYSGGNANASLSFSFNNMSFTSNGSALGGPGRGTIALKAANTDVADSGSTMLLLSGALLSLMYFKRRK